MINTSPQRAVAAVLSGNGAGGQASRQSAPSRVTYLRALVKRQRLLASAGDVGMASARCCWRFTGSRRRKVASNRLDTPARGKFDRPKTKGKARALSASAETTAGVAPGPRSTPSRAKAEYEARPTAKPFGEGFAKVDPASRASQGAGSLAPLFPSFRRSPVAKKGRIARSCVHVGRDLPVNWRQPLPGGWRRFLSGVKA